MDASFEYMMEDSAGLVVFWIVYMLVAAGLGIAAYVLRSLGVYTIAKRRCIKNPWFAWIPVVDYYLLGCISDQYQYVARGKVRNKRKVLLGLNIAMMVLALVFFGAYIAVVVRVATGFVDGASEQLLMEKMIGPIVAVSSLSLPMMVLSIVTAVFRYIALYDLYTSCDPRNNAVFLALGIIFSVTEPFFIFFNRKKELGMPPRKADAAPGAVPAIGQADRLYAEPEKAAASDEFADPAPYGAPAAGEPWEVNQEKDPWDTADSE